MQLMGLSLSFCVQDIIKGCVTEDDVLCIVAATKATDDDTWIRLLEGYCESYWASDPFQARAIVGRLRAQNKIIQPRVHGQEPSNISAGHWLMFDDYQGCWRQQ